MSYLDYKSPTNLKQYLYGGNLATVHTTFTKVIQKAVKSHLSDAVLLFGFPGAGKSTMADSAAAKVMADSGCTIDIVKVDCSRLVVQHPRADDALLNLAQTRNGYVNVNTGTDCRIFIFDEVDAIGPRRDRTGDSSALGLCYFCMDTLNMAPAKVVWVLVTNYPEWIDEAILSRISKRLHLPCPDRDATKVIIETKLLDSDAAALASALVKPVRDYEISVRGLVNGLKYLEDQGGITAKRLTIDVEDAVRTVLGGGGFPEITRVDEYRRSHQYLLLQSDLFVRTYNAV